MTGSEYLALLSRYVDGELTLAQVRAQTDALFDNFEDFELNALADGRAGQATIKVPLEAL